MFVNIIYIYYIYKIEQDRHTDRGIETERQKEREKGEREKG